MILHLALRWSLISLLIGGWLPGQARGRDNSLVILTIIRTPDQNTDLIVLEILQKPEAFQTCRYSSAPTAMLLSNTLSFSLQFNLKSCTEWVKNLQLIIIVKIFGSNRPIFLSETFNGQKLSTITRWSRQLTEFDFSPSTKQSKAKSSALKEQSSHSSQTHYTV